MGTLVHPFTRDAFLATLYGGVISGIGHRPGLRARRFHRRHHDRGPARAEPQRPQRRHRPAGRRCGGRGHHRPGLRPAGGPLQPDRPVRQRQGDRLVAGGALRRAGGDDRQPGGGADQRAHHPRARARYHPARRARRLHRRGSPRGDVRARSFARSRCSGLWCRRRTPRPSWWSPRRPPCWARDSRRLRKRVPRASRCSSCCGAWRSSGAPENCARLRGAAAPRGT